MRWLLPFLMACNGSEKDTASGPPDALVWRGGNFDFSTVSADDGCLGGALGVLFTPEGRDEPSPFEYPIYLPDTEELPYSANIDLRDPFIEMPVTIEDGSDGDLQMRGAVMEEVALGSASYGDCVVTMTVDADLHPVTDDEVEGTAQIAISDPRGEDDRCPVFTSEDCTVRLELTAVRR